MSTTVLYHDDADGFGAAFAIHTCALSAGIAGSITYIPVQYGQPVPELPAGTSTLFIVDFSYDRATCDKLAEEYALTVIDHHKTAEAALAGAPYAIFDQSKSGAMLAWEYFAPSGVPAPPIIRYVQDYDLWKFELPRSRQINLYISTLPNDFEAWSGFAEGIAALSGAAIEAFRDAQIKKRCKEVELRTFIVPNYIDYDLPDIMYVVPQVNATDNISELGNELCKLYPDAPFSVSYCDRKDGVRSYSLRSIGEFDVSEVAKAFGGGGHRNAAGFTRPL